MLNLQRQALRRAAASRLPIRTFPRYESSERHSLEPVTFEGDDGVSKANKPLTIFSGIQPTGVPHLGNYLGALQGWVNLQNNAAKDTTLLFSIVDLHAITVKQDPEQLQKCRKEMLASLIAVGLDPKRSILFCQSAVPQHAYLMWLLSCSASMGYLSRMTQWKSKLQLDSNASPFDAPPSSNSREALKLGLFSYPVLQAADVLLYGTTHVPVGEDQAQHLEFTRELAAGFNHLYGDIFPVPKTILSPAKRVMSLKDPTKKMSKSDPNPASRILITDSKEEIHKKIKGAVTDSIEGISYNRSERPGVSNLIDIMFYMDWSIPESPEALAEDLKGVSMRALKEKVADTIEVNIGPIREKYEAVMALPENGAESLRDVELQASDRARTIAAANVEEVKKRMGLGLW